MASRDNLDLAVAMNQPFAQAHDLVAISIEQDQHDLAMLDPGDVGQRQPAWEHRHPLEPPGVDNVAEDVDEFALAHDLEGLGDASPEAGGDATGHGARPIMSCWRLFC